MWALAILGALRCFTLLPNECLTCFGYVVTLYHSLREEELRLLRGGGEEDVDDPGLRCFSTSYFCGHTQKVYNKHLYC